KAQQTARPNVLFLISDDQSWLHTSAAGDPVVRTPNFDRIAAQGVRFTHSFCASPSCTPSRAGILTGQYIWRLKESGNLWSTLRREEYRVYPELLKSAGYHIGSMGKGWGPGDFRAGGWDHNPAGPPFKSFTEFLDQTPAGTPFCFWFGSQDPHRPYEPGTGERSGMNSEHVRVPAWLPDSPEVRRDILDYYFEIQRFDRAIGDMVAALDKSGRLQNTIVVVTSDNGMPFPRAKTNLRHAHAFSRHVAGTDTAGAGGGRHGEPYRSRPDVPGGRRCRTPARDNGAQPAEHSDITKRRQG
ncbi:MAG: sulfatase-like hydrolase/transferase, partial [Bryobacteraceae bacterium]|nr:sulfatase-like hydrolase/transferase [Bryobacteraceae bacterium]